MGLVVDHHRVGGAGAVDLVVAAQSRRSKAKPVAAEAPAHARPAPLAPDDLERIEGIGPRIAGLLQAAGITTFSQLATVDLGRLKQILTDAGIRIADPTTWAEQASLAAAGKWDELQALQDRLKGGRRV